MIALHQQQQQPLDLSVKRLGSEGYSPWDGQTDGSKDEAIDYSMKSQHSSGYATIFWANYGAADLHLQNSISIKHVKELQEGKEMESGGHMIGTGEKQATEMAVHIYEKASLYSMASEEEEYIHPTVISKYIADGTILCTYCTCNYANNTRLRHRRK